MSKKNSREAKLLRKEKYAKKRARLNDPCPKPEEYVRHYGFIPNEPYYRNSAIAWDTPDCHFAFRTKDQLVEYANRKKTDWITTRSGALVNYVSVFHTGEDTDNLMKEFNVFTKDKDFDYSSQQYYYLLRDLDTLCSHIGEKRTKEWQKKWEANNPFYTSVNTFCLSKEDINNLPTFRTDHSEIIHISKKDEEYNGLNDDELDNLIAGISETTLREKYVYEEGGLVIDEFIGKNGQTLYQPKKKEETWELCGVSLPFHLIKNGIAVGKDLSESILKD